MEMKMRMMHNSTAIAAAARHPLDNSALSLAADVAADLELRVLCFGQHTTFSTSAGEQAVQNGSLLRARVGLHRNAEPPARCRSAATQSGLERH